MKKEEVLLVTEEERVFFNQDFNFKISINHHYFFNI